VALHASDMHILRHVLTLAANVADLKGEPDLLDVC
jgi:hypothetical protein